MGAKPPAHPWEFRARFRKRAFGWKSQPAIKRVKEAVSEIKKVARKDKALAAEGAVLFLERVSPAIEQVDSSSGAMGSAVHHAVATLAEIIASAPADDRSRQGWLERLFEAHAADRMPYIELLAEHWGEMCVSPEIASRWADDLMEATRHALKSDGKGRSFFHGTTACLASLYSAGRHDELLQLLGDETFWHYKRWAARALAATGKKDEAILLAESSRSPWANDLDIDRMCEEILLSSGRVEEAYERYGLRANWASTYTAWFRQVAKAYPGREPGQLLEDLVAETPGEEGKWFAAAKDVKLFDEAIALANRTPCSPQTLTRAARDFEEKNPEFAIEAGMAAMRWLIEGHGYDITALDVSSAYSHTMKAATHAGRSQQIRERIRALVAHAKYGGSFVVKMLEHKLTRP